MKVLDFVSLLPLLILPFSIDVDTASYANLRRFVREGERPPVGAIRVEELVNYFDYNYPGPKGDEPFAVSTEVAGCPWNSNHRLALIALRSRDIPAAQRPPANLVFLLDVSGSMESAEKLPLVKKSMRLLVEQLQARDHVAIVTYAGEERVALLPTACSRKDRIIATIDDLEAGGSTNGEGGIQKAYELARQNFDAQDFADDKKDAGDLGAGHRVTALYELVPPSAPDPTRPVDQLKYQTVAAAPEISSDLFTLKIRHKLPRSTRSQLQTRPVADSGKSFAQASADFRFASSVAAFGLLLTGSDYKGTTTRDKVLAWAAEASNPDPNGLRHDFLALARKAKFAKR